MRQFFNKVTMVMLMAFLALSFTACGDDEDVDGPDKGKGKMSGWVIIDGKKYEFKHFIGAKNLAGNNEIGFSGFNKDPYKLKMDEHYNMASFEVAFRSDGSLAYDEGHPAIGFEFDLDLMQANEDADAVMYYNFETSYEGITATLQGEKIIIDGKDVEIRYTQGVGEDKLDWNDPTTRVDFHFEGTPRWLSEDEME